jgi:hypothetical protein
MRIVAAEADWTRVNNKLWPRSLTPPCGPPADSNVKLCPCRVSEVGGAFVLWSVTGSEL